jgi:hypothetical protein
MWQLYMGNGMIDAQNTYCKASGKLIKEMASRGVVDCVYHRFSAPSPYRHCDFQHGDTVTSGYEFLTADERQLFDVRVGMGNKLAECNRHAPYGWRTNAYRKSSVFNQLVKCADSLDDNTMYEFAKSFY